MLFEPIGLFGCAFCSPGGILEAPGCPEARFWWFWVPKWLPKGDQNGLFFSVFFVIFSGTFLRGFWVVFWCQKVHFWELLGAFLLKLLKTWKSQKHSKTLVKLMFSRVPGSIFETFWSFLGNFSRVGSWTASGHHFWRLLAPFWEAFGLFWHSFLGVNFRCILGSTWGGLWVTNRGGSMVLASVFGAQGEIQRGF